MRREIPAIIAMGGIFVTTILLGMLTSYILPPEYKVFGENTESLLNIFYYIVLILLFTLFILILFKYGMARIIHILILAVVWLSVVYVFYPFLSLIMISDYAVVIGAIVGGVITLAVYKYPEWYVIDFAGIILAAGVCAILGFSIGTLPTIVLLISLAVYDAVSVYKTKHMIDLADGVMKLRLPILLVIPKTLKYSFLSQKGIKEESGDRDAMFMGLGDIIIPGILPVSAITYLDTVPRILGIGGNVIVAISTLFGAFIGFIILMTVVMRGRPQAGLPLINAGTLVGYFISTIMIYNNLGLKTPTF